MQFRKQHNYFNLNDDRNNRKNSQHILVLTHLQNHETYLDHYFELLDKSSYTNKYISIGLLVTDSTDNTLLKVYQHIGRLQNRWRNQFYSIDVYQKDFGFNRKIRSPTTLARARNFLLSLTLKDYHNFVFWVDVELYSYPNTIFSDFVLMNLDVVVPNCFKKRNDNLLEGYDLSNWQESDESLRYQQQLLLNQVLIKDYDNVSIGRNLLVNMITHINLDKVPLDGIGATFTMVKATIHREGAVFPPFVYQHELNTEGFAKIVKAMGFSVYGLPTYIIYHF
ncbi:hypothetical protein BD770DRAFT_320384 [Pilaira anomala]|nr:hypothetical protein BD770DRAFT_320384 [Pilaira anomala]